MNLQRRSRRTSAAAVSQGRRAQTLRFPGSFLPKPGIQAGRGAGAMDPGIVNLEAAFVLERTPEGGQCPDLAKIDSEPEGRQPIGEPPSEVPLGGSLALAQRVILGGREQQMRMSATSGQARVAPSTEHQTAHR